MLGAYRGALDTDKVAAYGAVVAVNRVVDEVTADEIALSVYEALAAPGFSEGALRVLDDRPSLTLLGGDSQPASRSARRSVCPTWTCTASTAASWSRPRIGRCSTIRS